MTVDDDDEHGDEMLTESFRHKIYARDLEVMESRSRRKAQK